MKTLIEIVFGLMFLFVSVAQAADHYCDCVVTRDRWVLVVEEVRKEATATPTYKNRGRVELYKKKLVNYQDNVDAMNDFIKSQPKKSCSGVQFDLYKQGDCFAAVKRDHAVKSGLYTAE